MFERGESRSAGGGAAPTARVEAHRAAASQGRGRQNAPDGHRFPENLTDMGSPAGAVARAGSMGEIDMTDGVETIEAESMGLQDGYTVESAGAASGDALISLRGDSDLAGVATATFGGETGTYDVALNYFDESDGAGELVLVIDGQVVGSVVLDNDGGGNAAQAANLRTLTVPGVEVAAGAVIEILGRGDGGEFARVDNLEFTLVSQEACSDETAQVVLLEETFDGTGDAIAESDFRIEDGEATTSGAADGRLVFQEIDLTGVTDPVLTLETRTALASGASFEDWGARHGDMLKIEVEDSAGTVHLLDLFSGAGDTLVGSETGQVIDPREGGGLVYRLGDVLPESAVSARIVLTSDISASSEVIVLDNLRVVAETAGAASPEESGARELRLSEDFGAVWESVTTSEHEGAQGGLLVAGPGEAATELGAIDLSGLAEAELAFTARVLQGGFEMWGTTNGDILRIEAVAADGTATEIARFTGTGQTLTGPDGQEIGVAGGRVALSLPEGLGAVTLRIVSDISSSGEQILIDDVEVTAVGPEEPLAAASEPTDPGLTAEAGDPGPTRLIDFDDLLTGPAADGGGLVLGTQIEGISVRAWRRGEDPDAPGFQNRAMIFNSDPGLVTGGDDDLEVGQGGVLIISEDRDASDPDDDARGGSIEIAFAAPTTVAALDFVDTEEPAPTLRLERADGTEIVLTGPVAADGEAVRLSVAEAMAAQGVPGAPTEIVRLTVELVGSGAIDRLEIAAPEDLGDPGTPPPPAEDPPTGGGDPDPTTATGAIFGTAFDDPGADGFQTPGDPGKADVLVTIVEVGNPSNAVTLRTGADGGYRAEGLAPGTYTVTFTDESAEPALPDVTPNPGSLDTADDAVTASDVDANGQATVTVTAGTDTEVDAGFTGATLGDRVWIDLDGDGLQDPREGGAAGVTVQLFAEGEADPLRTTTTDVNGLYLFDGLAAGAYRIGVVTSGTEFEGFAFTQAFAEGVPSGLDSDVDPLTGLSGLIALGVGEVNTGVDAGLVAPDPLTGQIGDTVFFDANANGFQDVGEGGVAGVEVRLLDATGAKIGATQVTGADGAYLFTGLAAGTYSVEITSRSADLEFTAGNPVATALPDALLDAVRAAEGDPTLTRAEAADLVDSDVPAGAVTVETSGGAVTATTGRITGITLAEGEADLSQDAGLRAIATGVIGDRVWVDANANGIQDAGEAGAAGVTVELFQAGEAIATTTTDADGLYRFEGLEAGSYEVGVVLEVSDFAEFDFTVAGQGTDGQADSDVAPATGRSSAIALATGEERLDIDAGLVAPAPTLSALSLSGSLVTERAESQAIVAILDVSDAATNSSAFPGAVDGNDSGRLGTPVDAALESLADFAVTLVAQGRGDQAIAVVTNSRLGESRTISDPNGGPFDGQTVNLTLTEFEGQPLTAQLIADIAGPDLSGLATSALFAPVLDVPPGGSFAADDTIDLGQALEDAVGYLASQDADENQAVLLTASYGVSNALNAPADNGIDADVTGGDTLVEGKITVEATPEGGALSPGLFALETEGVVAVDGRQTAILVRDFFDRTPVDLGASLRAATGDEGIEILNFESASNRGVLLWNDRAGVQRALEVDFTGEIHAERMVKGDMKAGFLGAFATGAAATTGVTAGGSGLQLSDAFGGGVIELEGILGAGVQITNYDPATQVGTLSSSFGTGTLDFSFWIVAFLANEAETAPAEAVDFTAGTTASDLADGIIEITPGGPGSGRAPEAWLLDNSLTDQEIEAAGYDPATINRVNPNLVWDPVNLELIDVTDYDSTTSETFATANVWDGLALPDQTDLVQNADGSLTINAGGETLTTGFSVVYTGDANPDEVLIINSEEFLEVGEIFSEFLRPEDLVVETQSPFGLDDLIEAPTVLDAGDIVDFSILGRDAAGATLGTAVDASDPAVAIDGAGLTIGAGASVTEVAGAVEYVAEIGLDTDGDGAADRTVDLAVDYDAEAGTLAFSGDVIDLLEDPTT